MPGAGGSAQAPSVNYVFTAVVLLLVLLGAVLAFLLQLLVALLTWPFMLCGATGRERFHHIQSLIFRSVLASITVGLNPFWCTKSHWIGGAWGPPDGSPGSVIFVNHRSNSDPFIASWLLMLSGVGVRCTYKSSLAKIPVLGWSAKLAGDLAVHHGDKQAIAEMLDRAREILRQGYHILVFPEGTRSPSGIIQDFKPTFFEMCAELGCPAVPMCLVGSERAWPHGGYKMGTATVHVTIGEPVIATLGKAAALRTEIAQKMKSMARESLSSEDGSEDDPFISGQPYTYWEEPQALQGLQAEEKMTLLREGRAHERGAHLA